MSYAKAPDAHEPDLTGLASRPPFMAERFWAKVRKGEGDACWEWTASVDSCGYGRFGYAGKSRKAHRVAWLLFHETAPICVLHRCDNRKCVRPDHLFLGTNADNVRDMVSKGRRGGPNFAGEENPRGVLTVERVADIRRRIASGERMQHIADAFGVASSTIYRIRSGKYWKGLAQ